MNNEIKLPAKEQMKYEIAKELGLDEKVATFGWNSLSSSESGRIGGILSARTRAMKKSGASDSSRPPEHKS